MEPYCVVDHVQKPPHLLHKATTHGHDDDVQHRSTEFLHFKASNGIPRYLTKLISTSYRETKVGEAAVIILGILERNTHRIIRTSENI